MYERLKRLYVTGKLSDTGLANAVIKGWITDEQRKEKIVGGTGHDRRRGCCKV